MTTIYKYFVSYGYPGKAGGIGLGRAIVEASGPLENENDFRGLEDVIKEDTDKDVIIINFQLLSATEEPQS